MFGSGLAWQRPFLPWCWIYIVSNRWHQSPESITIKGASAPRPVCVQSHSLPFSSFEMQPAGCLLQAPLLAALSGVWPLEGPGRRGSRERLAHCSLFPSQVAPPAAGAISSRLRLLREGPQVFELPLVMGDLDHHLLSSAFVLKVRVTFCSCSSWSLAFQHPYHQFPASDSLCGKCLFLFS